MPQTGAPETTIQFNYFIGDQLINVKYRDARKNFKLYKGAEKIFYNSTYALYSSAGPSYPSTPLPAMTEGVGQRFFEAFCGRFASKRAPWAVTVKTYTRS